MKKALILGVSGQDGAYLAELLLKKGYKVVGASRDCQMSSFKNLTTLGIKDEVELISANINDFRSTLQSIIKYKPDEIYNLSGQSSVGLSFEQPVETLESNSVGTLNILEAIRFANQDIRFYNAGSSECFGDLDHEVADETTLFKPRSPYAIAKSTAFWLISNYRESYNINASTGILFNHESPLRPERFVTRKIISTACHILKDKRLTLSLGNLDIYRDWGWAPEYVEAMWLMLQHNQSEDFIIATGETNSLSDFINTTFQMLNLNVEDHLIIEEDLFRPSDLKIGRANPSKAEQILGWKAKCKMKEVIEKMIEFELKG